MPINEVVVDLSNHAAPTVTERIMSDADAADATSIQAAAQATSQAEITRRQQIRTTLVNFMQSPSVVAFMQDPSPTGATTVATLKEVIPALKAAIRALARDQN